jgi:hypothetical protein
MPSRSNILITAIWLLAIGSTVFGPQTPPPFPQEVEPVMLVTLIVFPILFFGLGAYWMPRSPFYHPRLAEFIDRQYGEGTLALFLERLKPLLLLSTAAIVQGGLGLIDASKAAGLSSTGALLPHAFFISAGCGFALAHLVLYKRKVVGVYSSATTLSAPDVPAPARLPIGQALRKYWWTLVGIFLFPAAAFIGTELIHIPFEFFILPFFAVAFLAGPTSLANRPTRSGWSPWACTCSEPFWLRCLSKLYAL